MSLFDLKSGAGGLLLLMLTGLSSSFGALVVVVWQCFFCLIITGSEFVFVCCCWGEEDEQPGRDPEGIILCLWNGTNSSWSPHFCKGACSNPEDPKGEPSGGLGLCRGSSSSSSNTTPAALICRFISPSLFTKPPPFEWCTCCCPSSHLDHYSHFLRWWRRWWWLSWRPTIQFMEKLGEEMQQQQRLLYSKLNIALFDKNFIVIRQDAFFCHIQIISFKKQQCRYNSVTTKRFFFAKNCFFNK